MARPSVTIRPSPRSAPTGWARPRDGSSSLSRTSQEGHTHEPLFRSHADFGRSLYFAVGYGWLFGRRENINRVFSFVTLTLAVDSLAFLAWFQFGSPDATSTWIRFTLTAGFLVPIGLVLFFFAFTGNDKKMGAKVLGIKARHFQVSTLLLVTLRSATNNSP